MGDTCKHCGNERVAHCPYCSEDIWTDVAIRDNIIKDLRTALAAAESKITGLEVALREHQASCDSAEAEVERLRKVVEAVNGVRSASHHHDCQYVGCIEKPTCESFVADKALESALAALTPAPPQAKDAGTNGGGE